MPANMLYHAMKPAMMPSAPPALVSGTLGEPVGLFCASRYAHPRQMKLSQTLSKRLLNATVDLSVRSQSRNVKIIQPKMYL